MAASPCLRASARRARIGGAGPSGLSPGQRNGQDVGDPVPLYRLVFAPKSPASARSAMAFALEPLAGQPGPPYANPHFDLSLASDTCAACHATHTAERAYLGTEPAPVSNVCFTCHDGSGALTNVKAEYTDPTVPANVPAASTWYSHPALATTAHTIDRDDEFSGRSNRHAECADCHQPPPARTRPWACRRRAAGRPPARSRAPRAWP